ncbi:hypothetical protein [Methylobacillus sp.]|uniref:hypothetical protein n=1 Tax=Methylobacillus sp. TaxID=56818 RepID=UPI0012C64ADC|nr:hypothetical protein [Methylobacillus sp.]MPS48474.1 hypothetical protein [Methylobacillus sp.]
MSSKLDQFIDADKLKQDVSVNLADLDNCMVEQPSLYIYYASLTVQARRQHDKWKNAAEILESQLYSHYRTEMSAAGAKVTEAQIQAAVKTDARYSKVYSNIIEAQSIWRMCEAAENAFNQRKDLILELARDRRKENEGKMRVLSAEHQRQSVLQNLAEHNTEKAG